MSTTGIPCTSYVGNQHQLSGCRGDGATGVGASRSKNLYRGVRQRDWGKWVSDVSLLQNRMRVWLGTYETLEAAAYVYDRVRYMLRGEYARMNFGNVADVETKGLMIRGSKRLREVDAKIQWICHRVKESLTKRRAALEKKKQKEEEKGKRKADKRLWSSSFRSVLSKDNEKVVKDDGERKLLWFRGGLCFVFFRGCGDGGKV